MDNNFEAFLPKIIDIAVDDLTNSRTQQYSADAMMAMNATDTASAFLPTIELIDGQQSLLTNVAADGPQYRIENNGADGIHRVEEPAAPGNAQQIVELIESDQFYNRDATVTVAGLHAIRAAIANAGFFQGYAARTAEVQAYINGNLRPNLRPNITLTFDSDEASRNHRLGAQPFVRVSSLGRTSIVRMRP